MSAVETEDEIPIPATREALEDLSYREKQKLGGQLGMGGDVIGVDTETLEDEIWELIQGLSEEELADLSPEAEAETEPIGEEAEPDIAEESAAAIIERIESGEGADQPSGVQIPQTILSKHVDVDLDLEGLSQDIDNAIEGAITDLDLEEHIDVDVSTAPRPTTGPSTTPQPAPSPSPQPEGEEVPDNVYLVTTTNCPPCEVAKDELAEHIEADLIDVIDIQESDLAADIAVELDLRAAPALIGEFDGQFRRL